MRKNISAMVSVLLVLLLTSFTAASAAADSKTVPKKSKEQKTKEPLKKDPGSALLGTWQCRMPEGTSTLVFESDSRLSLNGEPVSYSIVSNAMRVLDESGTQDYPYTLKNNVLTIRFFEGYELQFTKVSDKTRYTGEDYPPETGAEPGVTDEPQPVGQTPADEQPVPPTPSGENPAGQTPARGDQELMNHFAGTWWNATTNTETDVTLTADGRYFETSTASYSGGSSDQYGNSDMSWGTTGDETAQGTWTVRGTREQGQLTIFFQNGARREINYQVHVENGGVYWNEYYFNGVLYGKKTK